MALGHRWNRHRNRGLVPEESIAMRTILIYSAPLLAAGVLVSVVSAATAAAVPECTNTTPTTTLCQRPGNAQLNTSPGANYNNNWGWPWWGNTGGITIDLGGIFG
jgi:hypothetical protein